MLQHRHTLETILVSQVKKKKKQPQGQHIIEFHFYEMSRVDKFIETENILMVA